MTGKGDIVSQRRRARDRNQTQETRTGISALPGGSSGLSKYLAGMKKRSFDDIASQTVRVTGFPGIVSEVRNGFSGTVTVTLQTSESYAHEAVEAHMATRLGACWLELFVIPRPALIDEDGDE